MTMDEIKVLVQVAGTLLMPLVSMAYTWIATRDKDNSQHIKAVETALGAQIAAQASRLDRIESDLKHLPSKDDISGLREDMRGMQAEQESLQREMQNMSRSVSRIEDFLLNKG